MQIYCSLLKPKIPKWRQPNKRNMSGSSITMCFHSRWSKITYLKAQKCSKYHRRGLLHDRVFELIIHTKVKAASFEVNLSAVVWPIVLKADLNFELILYITIVVFWSPGSCFKFAICIQYTLKSAAIILFLLRLKEGKIIHQKGMRALSAICIQYTLESAAIVLFLPRLKEGKIIHQKGMRALFVLIFHSEAT